MQVVQGIVNLAVAPKKCVATVGNFDGVHLGHKKIFAQLKARANELEGTATVFTFRPHPQIALRPERKVELLNTYEEKLELLEREGIDLVIEEPFSRGFSNNSPESFVQKILLDGLKVNALFLGYDFAFGRERKGTAELLQTLLKPHQVTVEEVSGLELHDAVVSSSRIRQALDQGKVERAGELLGRNFFIRGVVIKGAGRGKSLGVPTANLQFEPRKLPRKGVYITRVRNGKNTFESVTNVGQNPTFTTGNLVRPMLIESHLFDFSEDIYGEELEVEFVKFLRDERKFDSPDALVAQIKKDMETAKKVFTQA